MSDWKKVCAVCCAVVLTFLVAGCSSTGEKLDRVPQGWDLAKAEIIHWQSDHPSFSQDYALEASGLVAAGRYVLVSSEKYARLLLVEADGEHSVRALPLTVPSHAELEGLALHDGMLFFCDEAHAAVYSLYLGDLDGNWTEIGEGPLETAQFLVEGVSVQGGKIGFEGIELSRDGKLVYLLLERSGDETSGCASRIYRLRIDERRLVSDSEPVEIHLEDCAWRLTGLAWWQDRLLGLKTQYPGERYEVVEIDLESGETEVVLEMTEFLRALADEGWSNNVEGIAVTPDGALWLVADNAVTGIIDDPLPPRTDQRTLMLRIPPLNSESW